MVSAVLSVFHDVLVRTAGVSSLVVYSIKDSNPLDKTKRKFDKCTVHDLTKFTVLLQISATVVRLSVIY